MNAIVEKFAALEPKIRWLLISGVVILLGIAYYFSVHTGNAEQIETLSTEVVDLNKSLREYQAIAARHGELQASLAELEAALKVAVTFLPETREIPELLTQVSRLGSQAGLEFRLFKPEPEIKREFYAELPVALTIQGKFHDVARFFDALARMPRIVNVGNIKISGPKGNEAESLLTTNCLLTTFRFLEPSEADAKKGAKKDEPKR